MLSAVDLLKKSNSPLIIVGKGAAYSRAERQVVKLMIMFMNMMQVHTILSPGDSLGLVIRGGAEYGVCCFLMT